jgi:rare lipoprotein A
LVFSAANAQSWSGKASYYQLGGRTASGGRVGHMTAAHRSLPFGTRVKVTNLGNGHSAVVTINDRGPFVRGRIIDVSAGAAGVLGMRSSGVARVRVDTL